ncbi:MAG: hypothetical protein AAFV49_12805, partial [Pseudomonadota bacterium]
MDDAIRPAGTALSSQAVFERIIALGESRRRHLPRQSPQHGRRRRCPQRARVPRWLYRAGLDRHRAMLPLRYTRNAPEPGFDLSNWPDNASWAGCTATEVALETDLSTSSDRAATVDGETAYRTAV